MKLNYQKLKIPFGGGVDTKTDRKLIPNGKLSSLENASFTENLTIKKRFGFDKLGDNDFEGGTPLSASNGLMTVDDELLNFSREKVYSYIKNRDSWLDKGTLLSVNVSSSIVADGPTNQSKADYGQTDEIYVHAWEDSRGGIYASVGDINSNVPFVNNKLIEVNGQDPKCLELNGKIGIFYRNMTATELRVTLVNPVTPITSISNTTLISNDLSGSFDVDSDGTDTVTCYVDSSGQAILNYINDNAAIFGSTKLITGSFDVGPSIKILPNSDLEIIWYDSNIGLRRMVTKRYFASLTPTELEVSTYNQTKTIDTNTSDAILRLTSAPTDTISEDKSASEWQTYYKSYIYAERQHADGRKVERYEVPTSTVTASGTIAFHCGLGTKAFSDGGRSHVGIVHDSPIQSTYWFMRDDDYVWSRVLPGEAGGYLDSQHLPRVVPNGDRSFCTNLIYRNKLPLEESLGISAGVTASISSSFFADKGIRKYDIDFNSRDSFDWVRSGRTNYVAGGQMSVYDGGTPIEAGFAVWPEPVTLSSNSATGGLTNSGAYSYLFCWEYALNNGERELSNAIPFNITLGASDNVVTASIPTLPWTLRSGERHAPRIAVYRTINNGTSYYRIDDPTNPTYNSTSSFAIEYVDTKADSAIKFGELSYLQGEVGNDAPPSAQIVTIGKNRVYLAGLSEDPLEIRFSKLIQNQEAVKFSDFFTVRVDQAGGPITALEVMDANLVIFKEDRIFLLRGEGPDDLGNGFYPDPDFITSDAGCTKNKSLVTTPEGIIFKSKKGFYMLDRSFQLTYVGADVEAFNSIDVTGAELLTDRNEIRFLLATGDSLLFDYYFKQWSVHTLVSGKGTSIWQDKFTWVGSNGIVNVENKNKYLDGTSGYSLKMETNWISLENLQDYGRCRRAWILGDFKSAHRMRVSIAYNYIEAYVDSEEFNFGEIFGGSDWGEDDVWGDGIRQILGPDTTVTGGDISSAGRVREGTTILEVTSTAGYPTSGSIRITENINEPYSEDVAYSSIDATHFYLSTPLQNDFAWLLNPATVSDLTGITGGTETVWGGSQDTQYQMELWIPQPRIQSIKFKFEDIGATGESYELNELVLDVGILPGGMRVSSEKVR